MQNINIYRNYNTVTNIIQQISLHIKFKVTCESWHLNPGFQDFLRSCDEPSVCTVKPWLLWTSVPIDRCHDFDINDLCDYPKTYTLHSNGLSINGYKSYSSVHKCLHAYLGFTLHNYINAYFYERKCVLRVAPPFLHLPLNNKGTNCGCISDV